MPSSISLLAALAATAATAAAKTVVITAGAGGLAFSPDSVTADVGDVLEFHFTNRFHNAVQGDFSTPCSMGSLASTGFDSGPVTSSDVFQVTVQNTDPIWFFCATPSHCQSGMVGVVNAPSSGDTLATYKSNAANTDSSSSAGKVQGGVVVAAGGSSSSSPSPTASPSTKPSPSATPTPSSTNVASSPPASSSSSAATSAAGLPVQSPSPSNSPTLSNSLSLGNSSVAASPSGSSGSATTPSTAPFTGHGNSLREAPGKIVILSLVLGLGSLVALMA